MTTFLQLRTAVSSALRDPDGKTFTTGTTGDVADMVNDAIAEIGRVAPARFREDITPVADTLRYVLRSDEFGGAAIPEIELSRVELWDGTQTPEAYVARLQPADGEYVNDSSTGWKVWDGYLELTNAQEELIDPDVHLIRVWGYSPYSQLTDDADVVALSTEREKAVKVYCRVEALRRLSVERDLFTQWQTRSNNTDVSPAALMNALAQAEDQWRRAQRNLMVLRELP